jgi:hypothetical protein
MEGSFRLKEAKDEKIALTLISMLLPLSFALAQESKQATPARASGRAAKWQDLVSD